MSANLQRTIESAYTDAKAGGFGNLRFTHHRLSRDFVHSNDFVRCVLAICKKTLVEPWTFRVESSLFGFFTTVTIQFVHQATVSPAVNTVSVNPLNAVKPVAVAAVNPGPATILLPPLPASPYAPV